MPPDRSKSTAIGLNGHLIADHDSLDDAGDQLTVCPIRSASV